MFWTFVSKLEHRITIDILRLIPRHGIQKDCHIALSRSKVQLTLRNEGVLPVIDTSYGAFTIFFIEPFYLPF